MTDASTSEDMSPELRKVAERAKNEPEGVFHSLAHLIDVPALERAYHRARKGAAVGVDGITKQQYGQDLGARLRDLHERLRTKRYRHQPIHRVHIPKETGKTRPIGVSAFEDKLVQDAVREVLEDCPSPQMAFRRPTVRSRSAPLDRSSFSEGPAAAKRNSASPRSRGTSRVRWRACRPSRPRRAGTDLASTGRRCGRGSSRPAR